jgi:hypothetical protein
LRIFSDILLSMIDLIHEINRLWEPVYPFLARQVRELYGRNDGRILDVGPFAGTIFELKKDWAGGSFLIGGFPSGMPRLFRAEAVTRNMEGGVDIVETSPLLACIRENTIDVVVFRGALFFPSLFRTDLSAIYRILRPGGIGFVGGGFGKHTPSSIIEAIGERSRVLNLLIGKIVISAEEVWRDVKGQEVEEHMDVISEGGLWIVIRKQA